MHAQHEVGQTTGGTSGTRLRRVYIYLRQLRSTPGGEAAAEAFCAVAGLLPNVIELGSAHETAAGFLYVAVVLDVFSRRVIG